jgi:hypothetical protein
MKAIRTRYIGPSNTKPSRIVAETGEHGQRIMTSYSSDLDANKAHAQIARALADKFGWKGELVGGGFPDGTMVWVFADSPDKA